MSHPIAGQARIELDRAAAWAVTRGAPYWFPSTIAPLYWAAGPELGVRPEVAWVQACHETGFGRYGRAVTRAHHNYCGLKIPDPGGMADADPDAHARFASPTQGVLAHLEHLALYAGVPGFPRPYTQLSRFDWAGCADPRHFSFIAGRAPTVEELGGNWAPSKDYGTRLVALLDALDGFTA